MFNISGADLLALLVGLVVLFVVVFLVVTVARVAWKGREPRGRA